MTTAPSPGGVWVLRPNRRDLSTVLTGNICLAAIVLIRFFLAGLGVVPLVASIRAKGARLAIPGVVDLSDIAAEAKGVAKIVLESVQELLLKLALQMARDDYEDRRERQRQGVELAKQASKYAGRQADTNAHARIIALHCIACRWTQHCKNGHTGRVQ